MSRYHTRDDGTPMSPSFARNERTLELLAVEALLMEELRAGIPLRLAEYLRTYPALAEDLIAFTTVTLPEAALASSTDADATVERPDATLDLSPGTEQALTAIRRELSSRHEPSELLRVAEERVVYAQEEPTIEELARSASVSLDALAAMVETSPDTLAPEVLSRIAHLLGVSEERAKQALEGAF